MSNVVKSLESSCETQSSYPGGGELGLILLPTPVNTTASLISDELRAGLLGRYERLRALEIEYTQNTRSFDGDELRIPCGQHHFAFLDNKRFKAQSNAALREPFFYPDVVWAWDGQVQRTHNPRNQSGYVESEFEQFSDLDLYLGNVGIPLGRDQPNVAARRPTRIPPWEYTLNDDSLDWEVLPKLEVVDGAACHVLQSNRKEKIWIDPEIGFGIRRREFYRRLRDALREKWPVSGQSAFRDYRLAGGEIWLPWRIEVVTYVTDPAIDLAYERPAFSSVYEVQRIAINAEVPDRLFSLQFPPETVVRDKANRKFYQLGDQGDEIKLGDWE